MLPTRPPLQVRERERDENDWKLEETCKETTGSGNRFKDVAERDETGDAADPRREWTHLYVDASP
jgi:hypothetical protein